MDDVLTVRTSKATKAKAQKVAGALGVSLSAVINNYLREFITTRTVTFSDETLSPGAIARLDKAAEKALKGIDVSPKFSNAADMIASLRS